MKTMKFLAPLGILCAAGLVTVLLMTNRSVSAEPVIELQQGDRITLVGNTLPERMHRFGHWETLLHQRFPEHELVVRSNAFSADEIDRRPRSQDFGSPQDHLTRLETDVVLAFFGFNESFNGPDGLDDFRSDLEAFVQDTLAAQYNDESAPRLALVSPIAAESLPNLPSADLLNEQIQPYVQVMREVADEYDIGFVDLFEPTSQLFADADEPLTINGIHLNEHGDSLVAPILDRGLFGDATTPQHNEQLRQAIIDKNFYDFHDYRIVNGFYVYGGRSGLHNNDATMQREREVLRAMAANRDQRIWALAQGQDVPDQIDDSNVPEYLDVQTNFNDPINFLYGDDALDALDVADGYSLELVASEQEFPELANPVQMRFDNAGRLWVATMPLYPHFRPDQDLEGKLLVFEDTNGDGHLNDMTVFADQLHVPTGFELLDGGVYVAQQPDLMFLKDTTGDGKADHRQRVLHGMGTADSHHALSAFTFDPQGAIYFQEGIFHVTKAETPHGPYHLQDGGVMRYTPRNHKLETFAAYRFPNPWGHVFNRYGLNIVNDGTGPDAYWATTISMHAPYPIRHPGAPHFSVGARPNGNVELMYSRHFPDESQGNFIATNVIGFLGVRELELVDDGSGLQARTVRNLIDGNDPNFRPVDVEIAPDGSLYVLDWHNPLIGHMQHNIRDPHRDHTHGRIFRLTHDDRELLDAPHIQGADVPELLDALTGYEHRMLERARRELREHDDDTVLAAVEQWLAELDSSDDEYDRHRLEALWIYQSRDQVDADLLAELLESDDANVRTAATRALRYDLDNVPDALELLQARVNDDNPRVRLEAVATLSHFDADRAAARQLIDQVEDHEMDEFLEHVLERSRHTLDR